MLNALKLRWSFFTLFSCCENIWFCGFRFEMRSFYRSLSKPSERNPISLWFAGIGLPSLDLCNPLSLSLFSDSLQACLGFAPSYVSTLIWAVSQFFSDPSLSRFHSDLVSAIVLIFKCSRFSSLLSFQPFRLVSLFLHPLDLFSPALPLTIFGGSCRPCVHRLIWFLGLVALWLVVVMRAVVMAGFPKKDWCFSLVDLWFWRDVSSC